MTLLEIFNNKPEAKNRFEVWYVKYIYPICLVDGYLDIDLTFWQLPFAMQSGVILEWLREQGYMVIIDIGSAKRFKCCIRGMKGICKNIWMSAYSKNYNTALLSAIEKALELIG